MSTNQQQQEEGENVNQPINLFRIACTHEKDANANNEDNL
jgi:hypothetical protein